MILLMTILISTVVLTSTLIIAGLVIQGVNNYKTQKWSTTAYFAAEAGVERMVWLMFKEGFAFDSTWDTNGSHCVNFNVDPPEKILCTDSGSVNNLAVGSYKIKYYKEFPNLKLRSIGSFMNTNRIIEIVSKDYY